jgi:opacity protein-like surface antigen
MTTSRVTRFFCAATAVAALMGMPTSGFAADFGYGSVKDVAPPPPGRTWYLKGTLGMHNHVPGDVSTDAYANGFFTLHHKDMKSAPFAGIGLGVECNRWLRLDVTGEYRGKFVFLAQDSYTNAGGGSNEYTADIQSWLGLVNAYVDLGTWRGITPYVGAGIGVASLAVEGLKDVNVPNSTVYYGQDNTEVNFAWALYAGMSYDITPQVTVDFAYRYLDLGDASSGTVRDYQGNNPYRAVDIDDVTSHDMMLSLRYRLDHQASYMMPVK